MARSRETNAVLVKINEEVVYEKEKSSTLLTQNDSWKFSYNQRLRETWKQNRRFVYVQDTFPIGFM